MDAVFPLADLALARRLERAEATSNARFVEARARVAPATGATWMEIGGAYAMFDGADSPLTQTFGLGLFETPTADHLATLEAFFSERGAAVFHEVSPVAEAATLALLTTRGYQPIEFTSVLYRTLPMQEAAKEAADPAVTPPSGVVVRQIARDEGELYATTAAEGWREFGFAAFMLDIGRVYAAADGVDLFVADSGGRTIATAALTRHGGVAHLAGASTVPDGRRRGAQNALLDRRLRFAAEHGCDLAMMGALPGSGSQRNAERNGFRIAYTRVKWQKVGQTSRHGVP